LRGSSSPLSPATIEGVTDELHEVTFLIGEPITISEFLAKRRERQLRLVEDSSRDAEEND
jgi:hypothetical protein